MVQFGGNRSAKRKDNLGGLQRHFLFRANHRGIGSRPGLRPGLGEGLCFRKYFTKFAGLARREKFPEICSDRHDMGISDPLKIVSVTLETT